MNEPKHWSDPYREASHSTLEGKIFLAACYTIGAPEARVREIGRIAFEQGTNIWHATWLESGSQGRCGCAACERELRAR